MMTVADAPSRRSRVEPWGALAGLMFVLGLAVTGVGNHRISAFIHEQTEVCAPESLVPMHVPESLFPVYWTGVALMTLSVPLWIITTVRHRGAPPRPASRRVRIAVGVVPVSVALGLAIAIGVMTQSLVMSLVLGTLALAVMVPAARASAGGGGAWRSVAGFLAIFAALASFIMAGATGQRHLDIQTSRDLCPNGFGAVAPF